MLKIEIKSGTIESRTVNGKSGEFKIREQHGWVSLPNGELRVVNVPLDQDNAGYPPGEYAVCPSSFEVGKYSRLEIGRLRLVPVKDAKEQAKAA